MSGSLAAIKSTLKGFILENFLPDEDPEALEDDTPLITGGILDSIATIKFASFVDERYGVDLAPHEMSADYIDTVSDMASLIDSKLG
jgi:acyl carrier protein